MIDIKASAAEKAAAKQLREKTRKAYGQKVSVTVLGTRALVLPIMDEEEKESLIIIDEGTKQELKGNGLQRAIVKSVGPDIKAVDLNDIVYVYPNQFEATIALNGVGYLVYQERALIAKDNSPKIPTTSSIATA